MNPDITIIHTDPTARYAPTRPRIARYGAVLLLAVLVALTVQSFLADATTPPMTAIARPVVPKMARPLCREFPNAHFLYVSDGTTPAFAFTCISSRPLLSV
jgi:hypothetical protein